LLQFPAVVWGSVTYGITLGWVVLQQTANATAFPEIYGFTEFGVGNLNIAVLSPRLSPTCALLLTIFGSI
jgi:hypothetical protein